MDISHLPKEFPIGNGNDLILQEGISHPWDRYNGYKILAEYEGRVLYVDHDHWEIPDWFYEKDGPRERIAALAAPLKTYVRGGDKGWVTVYVVDPNDHSWS